MTDKIAFVTGATGLLGRQVLAAFQKPGSGWHVQGSGHSRADGQTILKVDLQSEDDVDKVLDQVKPNVVVHCAAARFPDKVDKDPEGAKRLNVAATRSLARLCASRGAVLIYISTDYVFAGLPGEAPYEVDAQPKPSNLYGRTKAEGETVMLEEFGKEKGEGVGVVLRVPVLYGSAEMPAESAVNSLMDVVWKAQEAKEKIRVDHWAIRYPTNTADVAMVCADIATHYLVSSNRQSLPKVLQFSSEDRMTKYDICKTFGEIMGLPIDNIEANTEGNDPKASVQRPFDCHLSTQALKDLGISVATQDFVAWWRREVGAFRR